jgi:hypothetical protein
MGSRLSGFISYLGVASLAGALFGVSLSHAGALNGMDDHVKVSAVMSHGQAPGFVLNASDEDAKAIANEDDVKEVDADILLRNVTQP